MEWIERFEQEATGLAVDHGGRVIKTIGDEVLLTADDPQAAAEIALVLTERGLDPDDPFPAVRAGTVLRPGREPARGRLRAHGQHRLPAHLGGPAGHGGRRPGHARRPLPAVRGRRPAPGGR